MTVTAKDKELIREIVASFECDGSSDYKRMDECVYSATKLRLDNQSLWALVNRAKRTESRISFSLDD